MDSAKNLSKTDQTFHQMRLSLHLISQITRAKNLLHRLQAKVALITGGASGIGECTAKVFSHHGAKVVIADIQDELGNSVVELLGSSNSTYVRCHVTEEAQVKNAVDRAVSTYGKLDIMFNNAGIAGDSKARIIDNEMADFERVLKTNVTGVFLGIKHAARVMIPARARKFIGVDDDEVLETAMNSFANLKGVTLKTEDVANAALYLASDDELQSFNISHQQKLVLHINFRLEGKVALITGGASGIGECTARLFVQHGAKVKMFKHLGQALCHEYGSEEIISYVHCNVTVNSDVQDAVDTAVSRYGKLDIMFNNAGISGNTKSSILNSDNEDFMRVLNINVYGGFLGAKHAARVMIPAKKGCILFTASVASVLYGELAHAYTASKNAIVGLAKNLSVDLGQHGIRVNSISPTAVATPMITDSLRMTKEDAEKFVASAANLKEAVLEPEDVAQAALYLASDDAKYVSGVNLVIDGGYNLTNPSLALAMKSLFSHSN
uniref:Uncharacterized protein n=1 Tax=Salix viminalis TaxID=40686 RepID=A0A6N2KNH7_SALVM